MNDHNQNTDSQPPQLRLGEMLREHRLAKNTEIAELARTLILSAAQINAIESGSQASFHNQTFYLRALKKYIEFMDLGVDAQAGLLFAEIETILLSPSTKINSNEVSLLIDAGLTHSRKPHLPQNKRSYVFWICLSIVLAIGLVTAYIAGQPEKQTDQQSESVQPAVVNTLATSPAGLPGTREQKDTPAIASSATSPATANPAIEPNAAKNTDVAIKEIKNPALPQGSENRILKLTFSGPSWIQVVEQNGKRIEKVFTPQDSPLELDPSVVVSLVIGNARESRLYADSREIELGKFLNAGSGVARLNQQEIMKLGTQ